MVCNSCRRLERDEGLIIRCAGECKQYMQSYLDCLRKNTNNSTPCRHLNKDYLECRMVRYVCPPTLLLRYSTIDSGLMDRDDWRNLGLNEVRGTAESSRSVVKDNPKDKPNV